MPTAAEYFSVLSKNARREHDAWWLVSERTGTVESRKAKLQATLRFFGQEAKFDALSHALEAAPDRGDLSPELSGLLEQLASDLEAYVRPEELAVYRTTHFGLLPMSSVDGFCLDRTVQGDPLQGRLVVLNEGLWVCAQLLAKAFVLENLDGDFAAYRRSGRGDFEVAISHYLAPSGRNANRVFFENVPSEVEGELASAQSSMAILIMQFVVLHEIGHIVHDDFDLLGEYRFHLNRSEEPRVGSTDQYWDAEFGADLYALDAICRHSSADINRWANFITIFVFFHWLARVEQIIGRPLCPLHPSPTRRGDRLLEWMRAHHPPDRQVVDYFEETLRILDAWTDADTNQTMNTLRLTVRTKDHAHR